MERKTHWEGVYTSRLTTEVSWYQAEPTRSLELLRAAGAGPDTAVIDIGGGDSTFVDAVLAARLGRVTVLDISGSALARAQARLGARAREVAWIESDVTRAELPAHAFDVWHDRAVFHFLTRAEDRARYVAIAAAALRPGGTLLISTFAPEGPARCSGLEVARYGPVELASEFGAAFALEQSFADVHRTPSGAEQRFTVAVLRRSPVR
ncbi:MAG TPA: class I SAM-dependent methyltransferase [Gemmatimonadales bacterium]|nr:class I SAM-dependent methyltransferase [Gemmatimonadales bacterium]